MFILFLKKYFQGQGDSLHLKLCKALLGTAGLSILFGIGFFLCERSQQSGLSLSDSIWWAIVTMTTVGYGDYYPQSLLGRYLIGIPCFLIGISLIGYLLGSIAENIILLTTRKRNGQLTITMKDHLLICHCPSENKVLQIASEVRATAKDDRLPVTVICDNLDELPLLFQKNNISFVKGNPLEETILLRAGAAHCRGAIILAKDPTSLESDSLTYSIGQLLELIEEEHHHAITTVAEIIHQTSAKLFQKSKINSIVEIEGITDKLLVQEFFQAGIQETFGQLLTSSHGSQFYTYPSTLNKDHPLIDLQRQALDFRLNLQIIGIKKDGQTILNPSKDILVKKGDPLLILAHTADQYREFEASLA